MRAFRHILRGVLGVGVLAGVATIGITNAEQLEGVQVKPVGSSVQIILDTPNDQPYRIERRSENSVVIVMPKTKLPTAFQSTGLPPVKDKETGITAQVSSAGDGVAIQLVAPKGVTLPYEVRLNTRRTKSKASVPKPKSPLALFDSSPTPTNIVSNAPIPKADLPKAALKKSSKPLLIATPANPIQSAATTPKPSASTVVNTPEILPVPPLPPATQHVAVKPRKIYKPAPPQVIGFDNEPAPVLKQQPVEVAAEPTATAVETKADPFENKVASNQTTNGVNFLSQAQHKTKKPFKFKTSNIHVSHLPLSKIFGNGLMFQWFLTSLGLFAALAVAALLIGVGMKRRLAKKQTTTQQSSVTEEHEEEFFEPVPQQQAPIAETYDGYLEQDHPAVQLQKRQVATTTTSQPASFKKLLHHPASSAEEVLNTPVRSVSDAVRVGLVRKKNNPYLATPFEIAKYSSVQKKETASNKQAAPPPQNDPRQRSFQRILTYR